MMTFPYIPRAWVRWRAGKRAPTVAAAAGTRILGAHHENERPPFTPAIWVLLWATFWAGVVEAYAVMGSYSFQALPGVANALAPGVRAHTHCHERAACWHRALHASVAVTGTYNICGAHWHRRLRKDTACGGPRHSTRSSSSTMPVGLRRRLDGA